MASFVGLSVPIQFLSVILCSGRIEILLVGFKPRNVRDILSVVRSGSSKPQDVCR